MGDSGLFIEDLPETVTGRPAVVGQGDEVEGDGGDDAPTTLAIGEEGDDAPTTLAIGEEGDDAPTTLAIGEEGDGY